MFINLKKKKHYIAGSLMNLPVAPPPSRVSPPPPAASKSSGILFSVSSDNIVRQFEPIGVAAGLNHTCPSCGICFSSASTLSAHVTYYCSKRPQVAAPGPAPPVTHESPLPTLQPELMATPLSNGRSQTPEQVDDLVKENFKKK